MVQSITKKKKAVQDGLFKAELNNFLTHELAEDGYAAVEVRRAPARTEVIITATRTQNVLGERGRRIRELTAVVQKRFGFNVGQVEVEFYQICINIVPIILVVRRKSCQSRIMRCCPMRIVAFQALRRLGCSPCLLRCPSFHHGIAS
jgi:small subunit ribosomal protein S3e